MTATKKYLGRRTAMMLIGIFFLGVSVGLFRLAALGVDPFTCMNLGISGFLHMSFGNWQLIMNTLLLVVVFFTIRSCIGIGTVVNMVCVGYIADALCWLVQSSGVESIPLPLRIGLLLLGTLIMCANAAIYMAADMGIAPYDAAAFVLQKFVHNKLSFRWARVATDLTCVTAGVFFSLMSGNEIWAIVGLGTVITAFLTGPLIQFFRTRVAEPMLGQPQSEEHEECRSLPIAEETV